MTTVIYNSPQVGDDTEEVTPGYVAPKQVDLKTLQELDADDEALVKYKQTLLGATSDVKGIHRVNDHLLAVRVITSQKVKCLIKICFGLTSYWHNMYIPLHLGMHL